MKHKMIKIEKFRKILLATIVIAALILIAFLWSRTGAFVLFVIVGLLAGIVVISFSLIILSDHYTKLSMESISELIETIISLEGNVIISETEDTMLSKLQSQMIKLTSILQASNKRLSREQKEIKTLVSDISHQIKTPISSIKMYTDLLSESGIRQDEREEYIKIISSSAEKLVFLTDALIKMSRLESGIIQLKPENNRISDTILSAILQALPKAKKKGVEIIFDDPESGVFLSCDEKWTAEALFNIVDNGIKYSDPGGKITVSVEPYELLCRIDISDTGPGITEEEQTKVFKRFYRGKGAADVEGAGIGLYLSREIIEGQQGYISVKSAEKGSTFSVFLPIENKIKKGIS